MASPLPTTVGAPAIALPALHASNEAHTTGVSWAAVIAGAFVSAALALVLLSLGAGLGLSSVSPWSNSGASASTIGSATIVWLVAMQVVASGMGGYLAGRLRTKWVAIHTDEVFFRDTAHGFLAWAVAVVLAAGLLTSTASSLASGGARIGAATISSALSGSATGTLSAVSQRGNYFVDLLFRSDHVNPAVNDPALRAEVARVVASVLTHGELIESDKTYLAQVVAAHTGLTPIDAEQRVTATIAQAKAAATEAKAVARQAADSARQAAAKLSLWTFVSLLAGAFCASYAATVGGRQRDHVKL